MSDRAIIIKDLAIKVEKGDMTIEDVPEGFREEVKEVLKNES